MGSDARYNMGPLNLAVSTWSLGLPVCDATQSEDDSTLILLNNLQQENKIKKKNHSTNMTRMHYGNKGSVGFC